MKRPKLLLAMIVLAVLIGMVQVSPARPWKFVFIQQALVVSAAYWLSTRKM